MSKDNTLHKEVCEEMVRFQKTMQELRLLRTVSQDLKKHRKMLKLKKYD